MRSGSRWAVAWLVGLSWCVPGLAVDDAALLLALGHPDRPAADKERDVLRKPADVLRFFGVGDGSAVLDLFSGGGYYTEIVSRLVGDSGSVVAHNNQAYLDYAREELAGRYADGRLANVTRVTQEANDLEVGSARFDVALMVLSYHDIYYAPEDGSWPAIEGPALLATLFQALEPGGVLGVVDHVAAAGAPAETGNTLHRIDPALMRREIESAGFVFDGELDVLRNPNDDHAKPMYAEGVRGRTDRVIYRFRRPE